MFNLENPEIIDISPLISSQLGVFPGDQKFSRKVVMDCDSGDHIGLSSITTTVHLGAHADAPNHYTKGEKGIDQQDLNHYLGSALVVDVSAAGDSYIQKSDFLQAFTEPEIKCNKVLFKTNSFINPDSWNSDFKGLSPELIDHLSKKNVITVGIDTPSIDVEDSKDLPAHHMVSQHAMAILEGLVLQDVKQGYYYLMALPLKIKDCDASPVRAVLVK